MARDNTAPVVNVIAIDVTVSGGTDVAVVRFDATGLDPANDNDTVDSDEITITSTSPKAAAASQNIADNGSLTVNTANADGTPTGSAADLVAGDRITVHSGALVDMAGNKSRARTFTVLAAQASPRVLQVMMSNPAHTAQASAGVPEAISEATPNSDGADDIMIKAKKGGAADGAAGNGWTVAFDRATAWKADPKAEVDIDVRVNAKDRLVSVRFNAGNAKFADLKAALEANSAFDAMFMVATPIRQRAATPPTSRAPPRTMRTSRGAGGPGGSPRAIPL